MPDDLIGVLDVGKTHAKVLLVAAHSGEVTWRVERPCHTVERRQTRDLDVAGIEQWILSALESAPDKHRIRSLVPVAHGAAAALVSSTGAVLAVPDYEDPRFETVSELYCEARDPFEVTLSPFLPQGLNLGRQLFYLRQRYPALLDTSAALLLYPQFWAWRLSNVMAAEITSLGCHTDLWRPRAGTFSSLATTQGWSELLPPLRAASADLGNISSAVARATGLDASCRVLCGIHDSNASYLCYHAADSAERPYALVSSGTWTVIMAGGADLSCLRECRDMLANMDAFGTPVATARFMGGREYEAIAGPNRDSDLCTPEHARAVVTRRAMALPSFASGGGPFAGRKGAFVDADGLSVAERCALATLYCALQTDLLLDLLRVRGDVIVDGPLAANTLYGPALAALRPGSRVRVAMQRAGAAQCARILCGYPAAPSMREAEPISGADFQEYRMRWRARVDGGAQGKSRELR